MKRKQITPQTISRLMSIRPNVPEGKSGDIEVTHRTVKAGESVPVVSMRNAIFMGYKPWNMTCPEDTVIRRLSDQDGVWMTDSPQELWQADLALSGFAGRILIGGLGLGVVTALAAKRRPIQQVHTVEINKQIIGLIQPHAAIGKKHSVIQQDIWKFIADVSRGEYDCAFLDTWRGTGEWEWTETVVPLRRMLRGKVPQRMVRCWQEEEMFSQVAMSLFRSVDVSDQIKLPPHQAVFREVIRKQGIRKERINQKTSFERIVEIEAENRANPMIRFFAINFRQAGSEQWERMFGEAWDKYFPRKGSKQ